MFKIVCNIQSLCLAGGRYYVDFMCKGSKISDGLLEGTWYSIVWLWHC